MKKIIEKLGISVLDRYVISEFWLPFFSGAAIITGVWLSADQIRKVFRLITIANAPFGLTMTILGLHLPEILVTTIPIGVLWGTFLVFSRLNNDSEIIAMRTSGFSLFRILRPVIIFGIFASALTFILNEFIVPITNPVARKLEIYSIYKTPFSRAKKNFTYLEKGGEYKDLKRIFYASKYKEEKDLLKDLVVLDFTRDGLKQIYTAKSAQWAPLEGGWKLYDGISHFISLESEVSRVSTFKEIFIPSDATPAKLLKTSTKPSEMNFIKLWKFIYLQKKSNIETEDFIEAQVEFHRKFAIPLSCLLIALVGAPLGIMPRRSSSSWNYVILAIIIFQYYVSISVFNSMAETEKISPFLAAWIPNFILLFLAIVNIKQKAKMS